MSQLETISRRRDSIDEDELTPEDMGWDDRLDGIHFEDNPYAINNWKHYEWENGWNLSDTALNKPSDK